MLYLLIMVNVFCLRYKLSDQKNRQILKFNAQKDKTTTTTYNYARRLRQQNMFMRE